MLVTVQVTSTVAIYSFIISVKTTYTSGSVSAGQIFLWDMPPDPQQEHTYTISTLYRQARPILCQAPTLNSI